MLKIKNVIVLILLLFIGLSVQASSKITLKDQYSHYYFEPDKHKDILFWEFEKYYWNWNELRLNKTEIRKLERLGWNIEKKMVPWINRHYLREHVVKNLVAKINVDWTWTELMWSWEWRVKFTKEAMIDKKLDVDLTVYLIEKAIKENITDVELPVTRKDIDVNIDKNLLNKWINWIVSFVSSDFSWSTRSRIVNIKNAVKKYNWVIIQPWETFSFNRNLWSVNAANWFVKWKVIRGTKLVSDFGWGVCQVSTTMYRLAMNNWMSIDTRRNHSFSVHYYNPQGSDATIYLWAQDFRYTNPYTFPVVIQWMVRWNKVHFLFYWNKDVAKKVELFWPFNSNYKWTPNQVYRNRNLAAGRKILVERWQRWFTTVWYRTIEEKVEKIVSNYRARPNIWHIWW